MLASACSRCRAGPWAVMITAMGSVGRLDDWLGVAVSWGVWLIGCPPPERGLRALSTVGHRTGWASYVLVARGRASLGDRMPIRFGEPARAQRETTRRVAGPGVAGRRVRREATRAARREREA